MERSSSRADRTGAFRVRLPPSRGALVCVLLLAACHASARRESGVSPDARALVGAWDLELHGPSLLPVDVPLVRRRAPFLVAELDVAPVSTGSASFTGAAVATFPRSRAESPPVELNIAGSMRPDGRVELTLTPAPPFSGLPIALVGRLANATVTGDFAIGRDDPATGKFTLRRRGTGNQ